MAERSRVAFNHQPFRDHYVVYSVLYPYNKNKSLFAGYVQKFPQNQDVNKFRKIIRDLSSQNWLDRYTRAVFSEFAIYNANTNLFCVVTHNGDQLRP